MANPRRGEVTLRLNDETYTLCLTLGALAELEDAFGVQDLPALAERFGTGRLSSRDLLAILGLGLRGGGHAVSDKALSEMAMSDGIEPLAEAVVALLVNTFGGVPAEGLNPNPPEPQDA